VNAAGGIPPLITGSLGGDALLSSRAIPASLQRLPGYTGRER